MADDLSGGDPRPGWFSLKRDRRVVEPLRSWPADERAAIVVQLRFLVYQDDDETTGAVFLGVHTVGEDVLRRYSYSFSGPRGMLVVVYDLDPETRKATIVSIDRPDPQAPVAYRR